MSTLEVKELSAPSGFDLKIATGKTLDLKSQGTVTMPTGSTLQMVSTGTIARTTITSTGSWTNTGNTLSITPSSASSKILVTVTQPVRIAGSSNLMRGGFRLNRGSSTIWNTDNFVEHIHVRNADNEHDSVITALHLDSPATTSAVTYTLQAWNHDANNGLYIWESTKGSSMILTEVSG